MFPIRPASCPGSIVRPRALQIQPGPWAKSSSPVARSRSSRSACAS